MRRKNKGLGRWIDKNVKTMENKLRRIEVTEVEVKGREHHDYGRTEELKILNEDKKKWNFWKLMENGKEAYT